MTDIVEEVEAVVGVAAQTYWQRWRLPILASAAVLFLVLCGLLWWLVFIRAASAHRDSQQAVATAAVASGGQQSAKQAVEIIVRRQDQDATTDIQTRTNYVTITKQPGAADPVNPALFDAFTHAVCMRASSRDLPECQRLRELNSGGVEGGGSERPAPSR